MKGEIVFLMLLPGFITVDGGGGRELSIAVSMFIPLFGKLLKSPLTETHPRESCQPGPRRHPPGQCPPPPEGH